MNAAFACVFCTRSRVASLRHALAFVLYLGCGTGSGQPIAASGPAGGTVNRPARTATTQPASTATRSSARVPYTSPGPQFRGGGVIVSTLGASAAGRISSSGKEASEASVGGSRLGSIGAPGLSAPQAFTTGAVVGQPGLQRGLAIGFGPLPAQNIFTRSIKPISGPGGACSMLSGAGFSPGFCSVIKSR